MQTPMTQAINAKLTALAPLLEERTRRRWAAVEARAIGRGGIARVAEATGLSQTTIRAGIKELDAPSTSTPHQAPSDRLRRPGGGRKALVAPAPPLLTALEALVAPMPRGAPRGPLRWPCQSAGRLATAWQHQGYRVSERRLNRLLHPVGSRWQSNRQTVAGSPPPDGDAQC